VRNGKSDFHFCSLFSFFFSDNELIYLQPVPDPSMLDAIDPRSVIQKLIQPVQIPGLLNPDPKKIGKKLFGKLKPWGATLAIKVYEERKNGYLMELEERGRDKEKEVKE
jgi:hypothetical protein